jgi:hypothetical protein
MFNCIEEELKTKGKRVFIKDRENLLIKSAKQRNSTMMSSKVQEIWPLMESGEVVSRNAKSQATGFVSFS